MDRSSIAIVTFVGLLLALCAAAVTSHKWVPLFAEPHRGTGVIVVIGFTLSYIALTLGLVGATIHAGAKWRRNTTHRTKLNQFVLAVGIIGTLVAIIYAVLFTVG